MENQSSLSKTEKKLLKFKFHLKESIENRKLVAAAKFAHELEKVEREVGVFKGFSALVSGSDDATEEIWGMDPCVPFALKLPEIDELIDVIGEQEKSQDFWQERKLD